MSPQIHVQDLGLIEYKKAWDYQEELFNGLIASKSYGKIATQSLEQRTAGHFLFCEHPHVFTLGKSGEENNLLVNKDFLSTIQATFYKTNRGGDITYHGPGQVVGYPILDLEYLHIGIKEYIHKLEQAIILTLSGYQIQSSGMDGATGVWLDVNSPKARKICAIGVRASKFVTMHGFALNVNTDLKYFNYINPCGFVDKGVISMEKELGKKVDMEEVKAKLLSNFLEIFQLTSSIKQGIIL
jgi:lipoyl(octanoyl) transferase